MTTPQDKTRHTQEIFPELNEAKKRPSYQLALRCANKINEECGPELNALRIEPFIQEILDERDKLVEALRAVVDTRCIEEEVKKLMAGDS